MGADDLIRNPPLTLLLRLPDAEDRSQTGIQRGGQAEVDGLVCLTEVLAAFAVADDDVRHAERQEHIGADLSGVGSV